MGLDMYLFKFKKCEYFYNELFAKIVWTTFSYESIRDENLKRFLLPFTFDIEKQDGQCKKFLVKKVGYWRKANSIHNWIWQRCSNGGDINREIVIVCRSALNDLLQTCKKVLSQADSILAGDTQIAIELLPTKAGFFFGSLEYNESYIEDLNDTVDIISEALNNLNDDEEIFYLADY